MTKKEGHNITERPPVIAIMGHIDHGKSTLLDYIRKTNVVGGEAGGITQHLSAYEVVHPTALGQEKKITFLDTPGHEAFSRMRERGANIADIAVLIVSAEEGVKAQTIEAYKSITETKTPFIVAINKVDKPNANPERVKQELADIGIYVESYGGSVPVVPISAKIGGGVPELLDMMLLVAELEELQGEPDIPATGYVLEANLDPKIGVTCTLIVKNGTLETGDFVAIGKDYAKVKKIENFLGQTVSGATFSSPVRIYGWAQIPAVGAKFQTLKSKKDLADYLDLYKEESPTNNPGPDNNSQNDKHSDRLEIPVAIKTDVYGSLEAVMKEVAKLNSDKVILKIIHTGVGAITENDVKTASSSGRSIILGFHVKTDRGATDLAAKYGIKIVTFDIIYKLSEWLVEEIKTRTPKERVEEMMGRAKILKIFNRAKDKQIIGGQVIKGKIVKGKEMVIYRHDREVGRGKITDLQEKKIKTSQVEEGAQFGAEIDSKIIISAGDLIEVVESVFK
ncbi:MAG: translation initiation factor IF-2 [Patescibacteria group bacterium]